MYQSIDLEQLRHDNPRAISKTPFDHQTDAFEKLSELFTFTDKEHKAGILVLPTGAGKTFTSVNWICRNVLPKNVKVLWLAHTGHLLEQAYDTFRSNLLQVPPQRRSINMRLVSSDPGHSNASQIDPSDDVLVITTQTAISNTQPAALDGQGQQRSTAFERFLEHSRKTGLFVVLDEAHHAPAYGCRNLLIGGTRFVESGIRQKVPNSYFLGLTATPSYTDARRRGWLWEIFKDKIISEAKKADLMERGILAVPKYVQKSTGHEMAVDDSLYDRLVRQHKDLPEELIEDLAHDSGRNDYIVNDYLDNYLTYGKTIIFADRWFQCVYIKEKLLQRARERGIPLRVDAVYSHVDASAGTVEERNQRNPVENARILDAFKRNELDVLLNVRMLSEGTDVPNVTTVFITRQTTSAILLTQMVGRALRGRAAGGGKDVANIVFFVDQWKKAINFATPEGGDTQESETRTRGAYPIEFISIALVEDLSRQLDSGLVFADHAYLDSLPLGWYATEVESSTADGTETYREFIVVTEKCQPKFERFLQRIQQTLPPQWERDDLEDDYAQAQASQWVAEFFDPADNAGQLLDADLIKLARHYGQTKAIPPFQTFAERNRHDLDQIAGELLGYNEFEVQDKLHDIYHDGAYLWQRFYKSYDRFKTAFDSARNRIYHIRKFGSVPELKLTAPIQQNQVQRELSQEEKNQVFQRDAYTCQCCGKKPGPDRKVRLQVDHIVPFAYSADTSLSNSQTLCSICNNIKDVNEINFRVHKSRLLAPKPSLVLKRPSSGDKIYVEEELRRVINMFYNCKAVADIKWDYRPHSTYRYQWELSLFEGNNPAWLEAHKTRLLTFCQKELNCPLVGDIIIR